MGGKSGNAEGQNVFWRRTLSLICRRYYDGTLCWKVTEQKGADSIFQYVEPIFRASDYVAGNFENPVTYQKNYKQADKEIHLQTNKESVKVLKDMNFTVLNSANNHAMDYGVQGMKDTLGEFAKQNLDIVGAGYSLSDAKRKFRTRKSTG